MASLADLDYHWGSAYQVSVDARGKWVALPKDGSGDVLAALSEAELRDKIRADYKDRQASARALRPRHRRPAQPAG